MTPLCELALKYKTDKCPQIKHAYTPYYYELFKDKRESVKKVFELGIQTGASLRMWRDFFPNAEIYGADINPKTLFQEERITTFLLNESLEKDWDNVFSKTGTDFDIFIDDGLHHPGYQVRVLKILTKKLKGLDYIIEDVKQPQLLIQRFWKYQATIPKLLKAPHKKASNLIHIKL